MLQSAGASQLGESQQTGLLPESGATPSVQFPDAQAFGLFGSHDSPFANSGVAVGVGAVHSPSEPANRHDNGGAQLALSQHTPSGELQKNPG